MRSFIKTKERGKWKDEEWYNKLSDDGKYIFDLIAKYHRYFSSQDKKYRRHVSYLKITLLFLAMVNTVVLGLKTIINIDYQIVAGLVLSALVTFISAITTYFNFEEYWMRNIAIHIELNIIRDNFIFESKVSTLSKERIDEYRQQLEDIQKKNIHYWKKAIKRI